MHIQTIVCGQLQNNTYIVSDNDKVVIIDAACPAKLIQDKIGNKKVVGVLLTHAHFDHITFLDEIVDNFGCKCYMHPLAFDKLKDTTLNVSHRFCDIVSNLTDEQVVFVNDTQELELLDSLIKVEYTAGHTDCGVCYILDQVVFSGDTLFCDGVGRYDLPTSSYKQLCKSLDKLISKYKNYTIYPGHGQIGTI